MVLAILVLAAAAASGDEGIVAKGSLVVGSGVVTAILTWLSAKRGWAEKEHSALAAKVDAKFDAITEQLRETKDMVRQLFDRICGGKKKKK